MGQSPIAKLVLGFSLRRLFPDEAARSPVRTLTQRDYHERIGQPGGSMPRQAKIAARGFYLLFERRC